MYRLLEPDKREVLARMQQFYPKSFYETVASSPFMDKFYDKAVSISGIAKIINESEKPITIIEIAGGRGRFNDALEKVAKRKYNILEVDISREQLGNSEKSEEREHKSRFREIFHLHSKEKRGEKHKIVGDMLTVPTGQGDATTLLNMPNIVLGFEGAFVNKYFSKYKNYLRPEYAGLFEKEVFKATEKKFSETEEGKMFMLLSKMDASLSKLNILEAVRTLKENGVLLVGSFVQKGSYPIKDMEGIPLKMKGYDEFKLDRRIIDKWNEYSKPAKGSEKLLFFVGAFIKTSDVKKELIEECEKTFKDSFDELVKKPRFWEILNELESEEREKKEVTDEIHKAAKAIKE
jgi:hypothetical protein